MSSVDPAVFYWFEDNELKGVLAVHVDDFIWEVAMNLKAR